MIDTIQVTSSINLYDLISQIAQPAKGKRIWCPFCQHGTSEGNNSPAMIATKDSYKCFGCGAGGDAIDFVMLRDKVDFIEACKRLGWHDDGRVDHAELARRLEENARARQAEQERRAAELDAILAEYSAEEIWLAYSRRMTRDNIAWWERRGVPEDIQRYLELGYIQNKTYRGRDGLLKSPAYTIPYFHHVNGQRRFETIQYRLDNPERPGDRYRFENGLPAAYYHTNPYDEIGEWAVITEGAIKAIVTELHGKLGDKVSVLAVPSKGSSAGIVQAVQHCRRVWIALDPDCWKRPKQAPDNWTPAPVKLAQEIGKAAAIVRLPEKIDDMFLAGFTADSWKRTLKDARRFQ